MTSGWIRKSLRFDQPMPRHPTRATLMRSLAPALPVNALSSFRTDGPTTPTTPAATAEAERIRKSLLVNMIPSFKLFWRLRRTANGHKYSPFFRITELFPGRIGLNSKFIFTSAATYNRDNVYSYK
jgi:hypothetical protein